jgi:hypothetical protein
VIIGLPTHFEKETNLCSSFGCLGARFSLRDPHFREDGGLYQSLPHSHNRHPRESEDLVSQESRIF